MSLFASAALASAPSTPAPPSAPPAAEAAPPGAQASEAVARRLLDVVAAGDEAAARTFFAQAFAADAPELEPRDKTLTALLALVRQSGGIELKSLERDGDVYFVDGTTRRHGIVVQGMIGVRDSKIFAFELQRNPLARPADAPAWPPAAATASGAVEAIGREIDWRSATERFSGAVLIAHRGKPVLERAWGLARRSPDVPATPGTLFGTASASKMLTSVAVARLIDRGKLGLDTTVAAAVPALASAPGAKDATIRDVLGHRVSYGEYFGQFRQDPLIATHVRATELLPLLEAKAPRRAPDGRIDYSNANYLILAAAIEAADGRSYYDVVEAEILRPLRMKDTGFGGGARPGTLATGWIKDEAADPLGVGEWRTNDGRNGGERGGPAGGARSTARDMWLFMDALAAGKLVRPETLKAMWGDRRRAGGKLGAALGFMFRGSGDIPAFFGHSGGGGNAGVSTSIFTTPDREWAVIVLSNFSSPAGEMLGGQVMDYLAGLPRD